MLLVIARKFNDIFYSMSLPEWNTEKRKQLIIISNGIKRQAFPMQDAFDDVKFLSYKGESIQNIIKIILELRKLKIGKVETLVLSNPVLVTNQYLVRKAQPDVIIMIEDGSLNYSSFTPSTSMLKKTLQYCLRINQIKLFEKIKFTYLFYPEQGRFYFGHIKKLEFNREILNIKMFPMNLNGRKLFVGQPLYNYGYITSQDYNEYVNELIRKFNIDFYIPHAFSTNSELIKCNKINLSQQNITLEALAAVYDFEIYSFGSSVLYTCKTINKNIQSHLILLPKNGLKEYDVKFIMNFCDSISTI